MTVHAPAFSYLRQKLDEWKEAGLLTPPEALSEDRFRAAADTIEAVLLGLAQALSEAGLSAEVRTSGNEKAIGIEVEPYSVSLWLSPATNPDHLRAITKGGYGGADVVEWVIPYSFIGAGRLEGELQQAMVRLLAPRRSRP